MRAIAAPLPRDANARGAAAARLRIPLADGAQTTVHVAAYELGATEMRTVVQAINLDGGGSASLVCGGELVNEPRELEGTPIPGGRPIVTALTFAARL